MSKREKVRIILLVLISIIVAYFSCTMTSGNQIAPTLVQFAFCLGCYMGFQAGYSKALREGKVERASLFIELGFVLYDETIRTPMIPLLILGLTAGDFLANYQKVLPIDLIAMFFASAAIVYVACTTGIIVGSILEKRS